MKTRLLTAGSLITSIVLLFILIPDKATHPVTRAASVDLQAKKSAADEGEWTIECVHCPTKYFKDVSNRSFQYPT